MSVVDEGFDATCAVLASALFILDGAAAQSGKRRASGKKGHVPVDTLRVRLNPSRSAPSQALLHTYDQRGIRWYATNHILSWSILAFFIVLGLLLIGVASHVLLDIDTTLKIRTRVRRSLPVVPPHEYL
jgi:hypothetical protein